jgi:hypothetical protein
MRKIWKLARASCALSAASLCMSFVSPAMARDDVFMLSIDQVMASHEVQANLDSSIKFYFGESPHPAVLQTFGDFVANEKTNAFGKSDLKACSWVFLSAAKELQKRAQALGANAVINIHSYYKKEDTTIGTAIPCHGGNFVTGLALRGEFVKVAGP